MQLFKYNFHNYATIVSINIFGKIKYLLIAEPLTNSLVDFLKHTCGSDDSYALGYQQTLDKPSKSFWRFSKGSAPKLLCAT